MDEESQKLLTINMHKCLFRCISLLFGVSSDFGLCQKNIEQVLQGLTGVQCILDDILTRANEAAHFNNLRKVLKRRREYGLKLNKIKCVFLKNMLNIMGI